nr:copper resistance protein NlpE [uncultured Porphyromonas sp.]
MKKVFVSFAVLAMALASCGQSNQEANQADSLAQDSVTATVAEAAPQAEAHLGTYVGTIPGGDGSVKTTITLNADGTYSSREEFSKAGQEPIEENGTYTLGADGLVTLITPSSGNERYFKVAEGTLTLLDQATKQAPTGELAAQYILKKQ